MPKSIVKQSPKRKPGAPAVNRKAYLDARRKLSEAYFLIATVSGLLQARQGRLLPVEYIDDDGLLDVCSLVLAQQTPVIAEAENDIDKVVGITFTYPDQEEEAEKAEAAQEVTP